MNATKGLDEAIAERVMGLTVITITEECSQFTPGARWLPGAEYWAIDVIYAADAETAAEIDEHQAAGGYDDYLLPPYSVDIAAAWRVVERLRQQGWLVRVQEMPDGYPYLDNMTGEPAFYAKALCHLFWVPNKTMQDAARKFRPSSDRMFKAETAPHAICLAALAVAEER